MSLLSSHLETWTAMEPDRIILFTPSPVAPLFLAACLAAAIKLVSFCFHPTCSAQAAQGKTATAINHKLELALPPDYKRHIKSTNEN